MNRLSILPVLEVQDAYQATEAMLLFNTPCLRSALVWLVL